jgi:hypothetical protein
MDSRSQTASKKSNRFSSCRSSVAVSVQWSGSRIFSKVVKGGSIYSIRHNKALFGLFQRAFEWNFIPAYPVHFFSTRIFYRTTIVWNKTPLDRLELNSTRLINPIPADYLVRLKRVDFCWISWIHNCDILLRSPRYQPSTLWSKSRSFLRCMYAQQPKCAQEDLVRGADMNIIDCLPLLWNLLGETSREILKQTAGISFHSEDLRAKIDGITDAFYLLEKSVLWTEFGNDDVCSFTDDRNVRDLKKSAKKKKTLALEQRQQQQRKNRELFLSWEMLVGNASSLCGGSDKLKVKPDLTTFYNCELGTLSNSGKKYSCAVVCQALYLLYHLASNVIMMKQDLLLPYWLKHSGASTLSNLMGANGDLGSVFDVKVDITDDYESKMQLLLVYCFLSSSLLNIRKILGNSSAGNATSAKSSAAKAAQLRAGGHVMSDECRFIMQLSCNQDLRSCIRRVADSCNVVASKYLNHAQIQTPPILASSNQTCLRHFYLTLAEQIFDCGIVLFHSVSDECNAGRLRCNVSAVVRNQWISSFSGQVAEGSNVNFIG